jgi:hypothetical protein
MPRKNATSLRGGPSANLVLRLLAEVRAAFAPRGNIFCSYAAIASLTSVWLRISRARSAPSIMARLAPSPANGDMRCAASPSSVTPGTRSPVRTPLSSGLAQPADLIVEHAGNVPLHR